MPAGSSQAKAPAGNGAGVAQARFGTFGGVFTPCTLTILGVIMFLRFGRVVGNAGILNALLIVLMAKAITTLTTLSLSAIATNTKVKGGGAYFLISRSLGLEFGGSIGLVFFLAQAVSVAMYVMGFTEAFLATFPGLALDGRLLATLVNAGVFLCVFVGAGWTMKVQYGILAVLTASLVAFFAGALGEASLARAEANLQPAYEAGQSFFTMFALFFPAATGIMAGANLSGDLRDPGRSIPRGTLAAVFVTGGIYLLMALLLGAAGDRSALLGDSLVMKSVSLSGGLITLGIFAATLSSAIGSMMGAPRILQALARDRIFRSLRVFGRGSGPNNEPRAAVLLSCGIAQAGILLGDLNAIAPVITMFFMVTYGYLNLATFYESITRNPSYRPVFRFSHWSTALAGALGCVAVMFLISPLWAAVAILLMAVLHWWIARQDLISAWGDVRSGTAFERARRNLLRLEEERYHPKNWRPTILALSGGAWSRVHLAVYGHWLGGGRGILTLAQVIPGELDQHFQRRANQEESLRRFISEQELDAFPAVLVAPDVEQGIEALVQCHGIGAIRPNVVLTGWCSDEDKVEGFGQTLRTLASLERNIAVIRFQRYAEDPWQAPPGPIDVWWRGKGNGPLMLLLAHLLVQNPGWRGRRVRIIRAISVEGGEEEARRHLEELIVKARIPATPVVVVDPDFRNAFRRVSTTASVIFLGFVPPEAGAEDAWMDSMDQLLAGLGTLILVSGSGEVEIEA